MRIRQILIALTCFMATSLWGQANPTGNYYATDFNAWTLPQANSPAGGTLTWPASTCSVSSAGYTFTPVAVGAPLTIVDANPALTETVIPTAVLLNNSICSVNAPMAYSHISYSVRSGTAGLQEAINYRLTQPSGASVFLTPSWTAQGGVTSMITSAIGNANVAILDQRLPCMVAYLWQSGAYTAQPSSCSGGGGAVGPGTPQYFPLFTGSGSSSTTIGNSQLYYTPGNTTYTFGGTGGNITADGAIHAPLIGLFADGTQYSNSQTAINNNQGTGNGVTLNSGITGAYVQTTNRQASAGCIVDTTTQSVSFFMLDPGTGYIGPVPVTITSTQPPGSSISVVGNVTSGGITSYTISGTNTGYNYGTLNNNGSCPLTFTIPAPPAAPAFVPVFDMKKGPTTMMGIVRVSDFGADPTGTTDSAPMFNSAIQAALQINPTNPTIWLDGGAKYYVSSTNGYFNLPSDDGSAPLAASATCTSTAPGSGIVGSCTLNSDSVGGGTRNQGMLSTDNYLTPAAGTTGSGLAMTLLWASCNSTACPTNNTGSRISAITAIINGGTGYPDSFTLYIGPTLNGVPATMLPPDPINLEGYAITAVNGLHIIGNDATITGNFQAAALGATTYDLSQPYNAVFGAPNFNSDTYVTVDNLNFSKVFFGFANLGSYPKFTGGSFYGGCAVQSVNSQYGYFKDLGIKNGGSAASYYCMGGALTTRAPFTGPQTTAALNDFNIFDESKFLNAQYAPPSASNQASYSQQMLAFNCWMDQYIWKSGEQLGVQPLPCPVPYTGGRRMLDQDNAAINPMNAMNNGYYGIAVNLYSRLGRQMIATIADINSKFSPTYVVVMGPGAGSGTTASNITAESIGQCTLGGATFGSPSCPNYFQPHNTSLPCLVLTDDANATSTNVGVYSGGQASTGICNPADQAMRTTPGQAIANNTLTQHMSHVALQNPAGGANALAPVGSLGPPAVGGAYFPVYGQDGQELTSNGQTINLPNRTNTAGTTMSTASWIIIPNETTFAPQGPLSHGMQAYDYSVSGSPVTGSYFTSSGLLAFPMLSGGQISGSAITGGGSSYPPGSTALCSVAPSPISNVSGVGLVQPDCLTKTNVFGQVFQIGHTRFGYGFNIGSPPQIVIQPPGSASFTCTTTTTTSGIPGTCTLATNGSGITSAVIAPAPNNGTGATYTPGAIVNGNITTLTVSGGTGFPYKWTVYVGSNGGTQATATTGALVIHQITPIQHFYGCQTYITTGGGTVLPDQTVSIPTMTCSSSLYNGTLLSVTDKLIPTDTIAGLEITTQPTAAGKFTLFLKNTTNAPITYPAGTAANPWSFVVMSTNVNNNAAGVPSTPGTITATFTNVPKTLYNAASNALPPCNAANLLLRLPVSDATAPTYGTTYTPGGTVRWFATCSYSGTAYSWLND